jgi:hypothetical protein
LLVPVYVVEVFLRERGRSYEVAAVVGRKIDAINAVVGSDDDAGTIQHAILDANSAPEDAESVIFSKIIARARSGF